MDVGLLGEVVRGLLPTVGVTLLFGIAILAIVRADAGERADRARIEAEEDAAARAQAGEVQAAQVPATQSDQAAQSEKAGPAAPVEQAGPVRSDADGEDRPTR